MNRFVAAAAVMTMTLAVSANALADEQISETRAIDARVLKVRLDGVIDLRIKQGPAATLTISGDKRYVKMVTANQHGDMLDIEADNRHLHWDSDDKRQLRAELTLPNLNELVSQGVGASEVSGFTGKDIKLVLDGAGKVTLNSQYRNVDARLGGVGSMTLNAGDADRIALHMHGAGHVDMKGTSKQLNVELGGVGGLDAQQLRANNVELALTGLGGASVYAIDSARLNLTGLGSATVYGQPAKRDSSARGMGSVSWK